MRNSGSGGLLAAALALALAAPGPAAGAGQAGGYAAGVEAWRAERERRLAAPDGWLTVAGLFFLGEGENTFGSSPLRDVVLPAGPPDAGAFVLRDGRVMLRAAPGRLLTVDGRGVSHMLLYPRARGAVIAVDHLTLAVHRSGERLAIRMRDSDSALRRGFTGLRWYPVDEAWRVRARFVPHDEPLTVRVRNVQGDVETLTSTGSVRLQAAGETLEMLPVDAGDRLWFIFRDLTSGEDTYPAARFLYADAPRDGWTVVDFNRAYNPPCAFNPHTTCPLPPRANRLPVRIEAGELDYRPAAP